MKVGGHSRQRGALAVEGLWQQLGGQLRGSVREGQVPGGLRPVVVLESPPLAEVVREAEALKFVTLNPARQLGIDKFVGSLEPGKSADFVLVDRDLLRLAAAGRADDIAKTPRDIVERAVEAFKG